MSQAAGRRVSALRVLLVGVFAWVSLYGGRAIPHAPGAELVPGELIIRVEAGADVRNIVRAIAPEAFVAHSGGRHTHLLKFQGAVPQARIDALARHPGVRFVEPNQVRRIDASAPNDPYYASQWPLNTVRALDAWNVVPGTWTIHGSRVKVAVIDTGVDCTHPDFKGPSGSVDSAAGGQLNLALSVAVVPTTVPGAVCAFQDDHGHGTHTAGTVAAATQNGAAVASLGFPLEIVAIKVLDSTGSGTDYDLANAITAAADLGVRVISMSVGGPGYSQVLQDAVDYAWERNVLVVAAAGNSNNGGLFYPADAFHALAVAATDSNNAKATFSNFGPAIGIAAPGVNILSLYPLTRAASGLATASGTSMATPHVSALAGLVAMTTPGASAEALMRRIQQSATGSGWTASLGYGVINAFRAVTGATSAATTGSVVARVVDSRTLPIQYATVMAAGVTATTDFSGVARLANLPPGLQTVTFAVSGYPLRTATVAVVAGADSTILLGEGVDAGTVQGDVTAAGLPVAGASVTASANGVIAASTVTDPSGRYSLSLPAGPFQLAATALGYGASASSWATVTANAQATADLAMVRMGRVVGTARLSSGALIGGATLTIAGPQTTGATSDTNGAFATIGVASGHYTANCSATGQHSPPAATLTVVAGADTAFDCVLPLPAVTVFPKSVAMAAGQKAQFTAALDGALSTAVTWTRSPAIGTLSATGLFTAPSATNGQTVTITATSTAYPTRSGSGTVQLTMGSVPSVLLASAKLTGGLSTTTNKIRLAAAAPGGGATVALTSSHPSASVPATVSIPAGATDSAVFAITTTPVAADTNVVITASYSGATSSAAFTVARPVLSQVALSPTIVGGGTTTTANRVYLTGTAPAAGIVVSLSSANPAVAAVPASVVIPAGAASATFSVATKPPAGQALVQISGIDGPVTKSATLTVDPIVLSSLTLTSAIIRSGLSTTTNRVTLNAPAPAGGAVVSISASLRSVTAPATVTIPQGSASATFTIATAPVDASMPFTVSAGYGSSTRTVSASIAPAVLSSFALSPPVAVGGSAVSATVNLLGQAGPSGIVVNLANTAPNLASVPPAVSIPMGATKGVVSFTATPVSASAALTATASYAGVSKPATHTIVPPEIALVLLAAKVKGGTPATTNRVWLNGDAPAGGTVVTLKSSNPTVAGVPAAVTVAAGQRYSPYFTITTQPVAANTTVVITATTSSRSVTGSMTVTP